MTQHEEWLIWSVEHSAWWRPNDKGYTPSWDMAGRYTKERACEICMKANWRALNEVPVPMAFFDEFAKFWEEKEKVR